MKAIVPHLSFKQLHGSDLFRILEGLFELTRRPSRDLNLASNIASRTVEIQNTDRCAALVCNVFLDIIFSLITIKKHSKWSEISIHSNIMSVLSPT